MRVDNRDDGIKGRLYANLLAQHFKQYPAQVIVVHHTWVIESGIKLLIERRLPDHSNCTFEHVFYMLSWVHEIFAYLNTELCRIQWSHDAKEITDAEYKAQLKQWRAFNAAPRELEMAITMLSVRRLRIHKREGQLLWRGNERLNLYTQPVRLLKPELT